MVIWGQFSNPGGLTPNPTPFPRATLPEAMKGAPSWGQQAGVPAQLLQKELHDVGQCLPHSGPSAVGSLSYPGLLGPELPAFKSQLFHCPVAWP